MQHYDIESHYELEILQGTFPQCQDLQFWDDWDDARGNVGMHEYSVACREQEYDAACIQVFIDNFDNFLEELSRWQPPV